MYLSRLETTLDEYLVKKAPFTLPVNAKEFFVKVIPFLTIIFVVLAIPILLALLGLTAILSPFAMFTGIHYGTNILSTILLIVAMIFEAMAISGLMNRKVAGWRNLYYATLITLVSNLIEFNIVGGLFSALISLYILFQVREYYK